MLSRIEKFVVAGGALLLLGSCGHFDGKSGDVESLPPAPQSAPLPPDEANAKLGSPYEVKGESYSPEDNTQYDEVGYGSWYGAEAESKVTANGEPFNPAAIAAAHKTLPMPSYVEVTNLDTGKTILARVNDRGPFSGNRIIDLTQAAAQQLGVDGQGTFPVRVRRVNPPEQEKVVLRQGGKAVERIDTPPALLAALRKHLPAPGAAPSRAMAVPTKPATQPRPADDVMAPPVRSTGDRFVVEDGNARRTTRPAPAPAPQRPEAAPAMAASAAYFVQVGSFSSLDRAKAMAARVGGKVQTAGRLHRVVKGPYSSENAAQAAQKSLVAKGLRDARIVR